MNIENGLACRYCGKKWFPHDIQVHEKNCRLKVVKLIDQLFAEQRIVYKYPPLFQEWPLPPRVPRNVYNDHALREYQNAWQECQKCGRKFPPLVLADHLTDCQGQGRVTKSRVAPRQAAQKATISGQGIAVAGTQMETIQSIGVPSAERYQREKLSAAARQHMGESPASSDLPQGISAQGSTLQSVPGSGGFSGVGNQKFDVPEYQDDQVDDRVQCPRCGRRFAQNRISAHEKICNKLKAGPPPRDEFSTSKIKQKEEEMQQQQYQLQRQPKQRQLPPNMTSDGRMKCKFCGRGFSQERIEKHEQICKGLENFSNKPENNVKRSQVSGFAASRLQKTVDASPPQRRTAPQSGAQQGSMRPPQVIRKQIGGAAVEGASPAPSRQTASGMSGSQRAKFCTECGTPFVGDAKFCMECGVRRP